MSRSLSSTFMQAALAQDTDEVPIVLITIDHDEILDGPLRFSSDGVDTTSRGNTYYSYPFELTLPQDDADQLPRARLRIDNIAREIVQGIREISSAPEVMFEIVLASDPDTVEMSMPDFKLKNAGWDSLVVEGELTVEDFADEPYPADKFTPAEFPGMFY